MFCLESFFKKRWRDYIRTYRPSYKTDVNVEIMWIMAHNYLKCRIIILKTDVNVGIMWNMTHNYLKCRKKSLESMHLRIHMIFVDYVDDIIITPIVSKIKYLGLESIPYDIQSTSG